MASLRRNKAQPNDATSSRFLYTIMKQLDHKLIDWNLVAKELEITNGHAARMRFSRFRQHMEGSPTVSRKGAVASSEPKAKRKRSTKSDEKQPKVERSVKRDSGSNGIKVDSGTNDLGSTGALPMVKPDPYVKSEPEDIAMDGHSADVKRASQMDLLLPKQEPLVKTEFGEDAVSESVPFESLIDPAICEFESPKFQSPGKRIKKEDKPQPVFTFGQYRPDEDECSTSCPGLPFLGILPASEGI